MHDLTESQRQQLSKNPNVQKITDKNIQYTTEFQLRAIDHYLNGKSSNDIFVEAGINPKWFKAKYCNSCLKRWKKKFEEHGEEAFRVEQRGSGKKSQKPTYEELEAIVAIQREMLGYAKK